MSCMSCDCTTSGHSASILEVSGSWGAIVLLYLEVKRMFRDAQTCVPVARSAVSRDIAPNAQTLSGASWRRCTLVSPAHLPAANDLVQLRGQSFLLPDRFLLSVLNVRLQQADQTFNLN